MLDWLIIGGGIHGTYLSHYFTRIKGVSRDRVRVLDPHAEPLALWTRYTANTGMSYLRSPHVHNLDFDPLSLATFVRTGQAQAQAAFIPTLNRPSLALFQAHSAWLIAKHQLAALRIQGRADGLTRLADGWRVETADGALAARRVILAFGVTEQPYSPDWALPDARVTHVFAPGFERTALPTWREAVVVGAGITAAQTALALAERQPSTVTLLMRHPPRIFPFDAELCWIRADCVSTFQRETDYVRRRQQIRAARHTGSMPDDVALALDQAVGAGRLRICIDTVTHMTSGDTLTLSLASGAALRADRVVLATGFETRRPGGAWLDNAVAALGLPLAPDGYPRVGRDLAWAEGLFVSGALAELEVGPVARNLIGARLAGERIGTHT